MSEQVHFIPVGFDFDRLIQPISKQEIAADRVILITHEGDPSDGPTNRASQLAGEMKTKLANTFELINVDVEFRPLDIEEIYDYKGLYQISYWMIWEELKEGNEVFVNISSMPRTVSFAFATAANSLVSEKQTEVEQIRDKIHTYYVAPREYLVLDMIEVLEDQASLLTTLMSEKGDLRMHEQLGQIQEVLDRIDNNGVTEGTRDDLESGMFVEFPASPGSNVQGFEERILRFLNKEGTYHSTSELAEELAKEMSEDYDDSLRSRVQYNVSNLDTKGYVSRVKAGNRLETRLSTMGEMWVETHGPQT